MNIFFYDYEYFYIKNLMKKLVYSFFSRKKTRLAAKSGHIVNILLKKYKDIYIYMLFEIEILNS